MRMQRSCLATLCLGAFVEAQNASAVNFTNCCTSAQDATAFAVAYALPLVAFQNYTINLGAVGANTIINQRNLSSPIQNVVRPNADTLYSNIFVDLSKHNLVLTVPDINDGRYYVFPAYDPYGNQFAEVSSVNKAPPGRYLIRRADDANAVPGLDLTPKTADDIPKFKGIFNFPTTHGSFVIRMLLRHNTTAELAAVHAWQDDIKLETRRRANTQPYAPQAPALTPALLNTSGIDSQAGKALTLLARLGQFNQPEVLSERYRVASILGQAGIVNGQYLPPAGVDLSLAYASALATVQTFIRTPSNLIIEANGWALQKPSYQGNFFVNYAARLVIALQGYLELVASEALYPTYIPATPTSLGPTEAYLVTFFGRPPVITANNTGGFWSLTIYGANQFLIPNQLNRYEVGDRSALTYPDGSLVYPQTNSSSNSTASDTRQFQVLIQPQDVAPPKNWTSNWLPTTAGGGGLFVTLRWYAPSAAFLDGSYSYPLIQKVAAITG